MAKEIKDAGAAANIILGLAVSAMPLIDRCGLALAAKLEERKKIIDISSIVSEKGYVKLDVAKKLLEESGLKVYEAVAKADGEFRDCSEFDVVYIDCKHKSKVPPGTLAGLYYVTAEVIEKSRQLHAEAERQKAEAEQMKTEKREEKSRKRLARTVKLKQKRGAIAENIKRVFFKRSGS